MGMLMHYCGDWMETRGSHSHRLLREWLQRFDAGETSESSFRGHACFWDASSSSSCVFCWAAESLTAAAIRSSSSAACLPAFSSLPLSSSISGSLACRVHKRLFSSSFAQIEALDETEQTIRGQLNSITMTVLMCAVFLAV